MGVRPDWRKIISIEEVFVRTDVLGVFARRHDSIQYEYVLECGHTVRQRKTRLGRKRFYVSCPWCADERENQGRRASG